MNFSMTTLGASAALTAALLLSGTAAQAQTQPAAPAAAHHHGAAALDARLQSIGASTAQRAQIQAILQQAHADLRQQHQAAGNLRQQMAQALAAPNVDATAVEALRQQMLARHDAASQRMLQARLQVAAVLSAEQRQQLLALMQQQHGHRGMHSATGTPSQG